MIRNNPHLEGSVKADLSGLAIFGGSPAFSETLHVGRPNIGDRNQLLKRINQILDNRWLTNNGPTVQEFERKVTEMVGTKHCVAMCNATVALEIVIRALGLTGEVIVPSFTFIATAHALEWQEIKPVFCDVDPLTHNIDPQRIEELITPRTTGIIGVHLWGRACKVEQLQEIADRHNLKLLFDAAHAFGCSYKGQMIGSFGTAEVLSFHATKFLNTLEGGAVVTDDDQLAQKMRLMNNFGFTYYDRTESVGTNGKMNEFSAAVGLTNLESMHDFIEVNVRNYQQYCDELADVPGISVISFDSAEKCNYQYVVIEVDKVGTLVTRDELQRVLHAENVLARRYFYPGCHRMEPYRSKYPDEGLMLPATERLTERVLTLPTGTAVGSREISRVCEIINRVVANGAEVHNRLESAPK